MSNRNKVTAYLSDDLFQKVTSEADRYSMSISAYICMCISTFQAERSAINQLANIDNYLQRLEALKEK